MSAPTAHRDADADMIAAINTAIGTRTQIGTNLLLSCGEGFYVTGIREKGEHGHCGQCGEFVTVVQAFPVLDV